MQEIINTISEKTGITAEFFIHKNYACYNGDSVIVLIEQIGDNDGKVTIQHGNELASEQTGNLYEVVLLGTLATK